MKLSQCKYGVLVKDIVGLEDGGDRIGMVMGLGKSVCKEAVPFIKWFDQYEFELVHHCKIELYED